MKKAVRCKCGHLDAEHDDHRLRCYAYANKYKFCKCLKYSPTPVRRRNGNG